MTTVHYQIPRNSLLWMLAAQAAVVAPHFFQHLPLWMLLAWALIIVWRVQIYRGVWSYPGMIVKTSLIVICVGGLVSQYGRFFGLEPMLGLLITAFLLKLLEMHKKRDALIVVYMGYFVAATVFLLFTTVFATVYIFFTVILLTTALIGLNQYQGVSYPWRTMGLASKMVLQSLPMMVVLFVAMPRIGSLWAVPQSQNSARTGVSSTMSPGDFSHLAEDDTVAFRVTFKDTAPPMNKLYWRGLTLSNFDGRTWEASDFRSYYGDGRERRQRAIEDWQQRVQPMSEAIEYEVILEPHFQYWLYVLPTPDPVRDSFGFTRDFSLVDRRPLAKRLQYTQKSYLDYRWDAEGLDSRNLRRDTRLPDGFNPQSISRALTWRAEVNSDREYIDRVLNYFNQRFVYTLDPPLLGEHTVDEFMWQTQRGFCEHFSSAFVVMMRAVGIPARVVVGYQGGEFNPVKNFVSVRNSEAHAWSEVWLEGEGWVRVDPTAAVAPNRIEYNLRESLSAAEANRITGTFTLSGYSSMPLFNRLRYQLEAMEYSWHSIVMGYDQEKQNMFLRSLLGEITPLRFALALLTIGGLLFGLVGLLLFLSGRNKIRDPGERLFRQFLTRLENKGVTREIGEGPRSLALRVNEVSPDLAPWVNKVVRNYEYYAYAGKPEALAALRQSVFSPA